MLGALQLLPAATIVLAIVTIGMSCGLATYLNHVPNYPQISMCGIFPPERYVFTLGLDLVGFLICCLLFLNHSRIEKQSRKNISVFASGLHLGLGISSAISLALMATVPVSEFPVAHVLFAVTFFVLLLIYQMMNTWLRIRATINTFGSFFSADSGSVAKELWMIFWMLSTLVGFVIWQTTGSSVAQYIAVASVILHFAPYIRELQDSSLHLTVQQDEQVDEAAAWLRGGAAERVGGGAAAQAEGRKLRRGPIWVAAAVVVAAGLGLGLLIAHLRLNVQGREVQQAMPKPHELRRIASARRHVPYVYRGPA